jgi:hypothetical protein
MRTKPGPGTIGKVKFIVRNRRVKRWLKKRLRRWRRRMNIHLEDAPKKDQYSGWED